jgi:hypothetical protein
MFRHDINHSSVPNLLSAVKGTDGNDWYDRYPIFGGQVDSATVSGNTLYTAQGTGRDYCTANCSSKTPTLKQELTEPAVFTARYDVNSWSDVGERWIWNPTLAFGWPALQTDGAGDVGLVFRASAANQNAQPVAGFLTPSEQFVFAEPAGLPHETGDYYSLRPGRTSQSFVMTAQTVETDAFGNPRMHWEYIEYGHGASPYVAPPNVRITAPANGARAFCRTISAPVTVQFTATAGDPNSPPESLTYSWTDSINGAAPIQVSTQLSPSLGLACEQATANRTTHELTLTATNTSGKSASAQVQVITNLG